jgi:hypothetical protein
VIPSKASFIHRGQPYPEKPPKRGFFALILHKQCLIKEEVMSAKKSSLILSLIILISIICSPATAAMPAEIEEGIEDDAILLAADTCIVLFEKMDDVTGCVGPSDNVTYSIWYRAQDYSDTNVVVTDSLPDEVEFVSATGDWIYDSGIVTWNIGTLEPNEWNSVTLTVKVKCPQPGGMIMNQCEIAGDCIPNTTADEYTPVCSDYPMITKMDDVNSCVGPGDNITYSICYATQGYGDTNNLITDTLPVEVEFVSADANGVYDPCLHTVTWEIGTFSSGDEGCVTLTVKVKCPQPGGIIMNQCQMTGNCIPPDIIAYEFTHVCNYPVIVKMDDVNGCVGPGDDTTYSICYAAQGYGDTNVVITDSLPNEVEFVSATGDWIYDSGTVTWNIGTIGPNDSNCVTLTVKVKCPEPGGIIMNQCQVNGDCITNITADEYTHVCSNYPVIVKMDDVNGCVGPGDDITYSICYASQGYGDTNVVIIDSLPDEVEFVSATGDWIYNSGTVSWNIGTIGPNDSNCVTLTVKVKCPEPLGTITNCCRMTGNCIDINTCEYTCLKWWPPICCCPIYVDVNATGANNGCLWEDAFTNLQDALLAAEYCNCNEILVAAGLYKPDCNSADPNGTGDRDATFRLINNVAIYGGFPAGGGPWESRDPNDPNNETILSGDLEGNDRQDLDPCDLFYDPCRTDNSYHVVTGSDTDETAVLDGFTITGGNGSGYGGGMYNYSGDPTVKNCTFIRNAAANGGGMYNDSDSSPTITNCTFSDNGAVNDPGASYGGGMYNTYDSNPTVTNCTFSRNSVGPSPADYGGGMYNAGNATIDNCTFIGNSVSDGGGGYGGGIYNESGSPTISNCTFVGNMANAACGAGGGIYNISDANIANCTFSRNTAYGNDEFNGSGGGMYNSGMPIITNCTFNGNSASDGGGAMDNFGYPTITNCTFSENSASYGGAMHNFESMAIITNCLFSGNSAINGGGMYNNDGGPITIANCTFTGNIADANGGGIYNINYGDRRIINCIFWDNEALNDGNEVYNYGYYPAEPIDPIFSNCDIRGYGVLDSNFGPDGIVNGGGNINADPCFVEAGYWDDNNTPSDANDDFWVDGNYRLLSGSPCIDAGDNNSVPPDYADLDNDGDVNEPTPFDIDLFPRFIDGDCNDSNVVDMGAYEFLHSDIDHSGSVNFEDFAEFALQWLESGCGLCFGADLNCDENVDCADLDKFTQWWLVGVAF